MWLGPFPDVKYNSICSVAATPTEHPVTAPTARFEFLLLADCCCCCLMVLLIRICNQFWVLRAFVAISFDALAISRSGSQPARQQRTSIRVWQRARAGLRGAFDFTIESNNQLSCPLRLPCCLPVGCNFYWPHFC